MEDKYFKTDSTGSKNYFKDDEKDIEKLEENKEIKDFTISTEKYDTAEVKVEIIKYDIKD
jgi:hypothetical protein